jgi:hypothetical protein
MKLRFPKREPAPGCDGCGKSSCNWNGLPVAEGRAADMPKQLYGCNSTFKYRGKGK